MTKVSNKEPLISIIVPVYNVEKYIDKCIESIVNQNYKNLEIILVDDGSPDNCPKICDQWAKKDKRIMVIHKKNGGLSDARNAGIDVCNGEYLTFVDSDDYISNNYIMILINLILDNNSDLAIAKHYIVIDDKVISTGSGKKYILKPHDAFEKLLYSDDLDVSAWAKLYKMSLFDNVRYPKGRLYEDAATTYKLFDKSKLICFYSIPIYYYVIRDNSITTKGFDSKKMDLILSTNEMTDYLFEHYKDLEKACNRRKMYAYLSTLSQFCNSPKNNTNNYLYYRNVIYNYVKKNRVSIFFDKRTPNRDKIALLCTLFGFNFFKFGWNFYLNKIKKLGGKNENK